MIVLAKGDAVPASVQVHGTILAVAAAPVAAAIDMQRTVSDEMKKQDAYTTMRAYAMKRPLLDNALPSRAARPRRK